LELADLLRQGRSQINDADQYYSVQRVQSA